MQGRAGPTRETTLGWALRPRPGRQLSTEEELCRHRQAHGRARRSPHGRVSLRGLLVCFSAEAPVPCKAHGCACGMCNWALHCVQSSSLRS